METSLSNGAASSQEKENKIEGLERVKLGSLLLSVLALILTIKSMQQIIQVGDLIVMFLEIRVVKVV